MNHIVLKNVSLNYSAAAYKERSLKAFLTNKFLRSGFQIPEITNIYALKDISIEIQKGERVGLLGHNGAGKSTFLKAITELYPISSGELDIVGKVRSLLELNLGFETEATGRENILYRGLLMGLLPKQIKEKEEEIVDFCDIGKFIDYPLKTYSAGMKVRLAFAISTAVSGDILLLDEVIGAGDARFMKKAKQRIRTLINHSEILVLASHDYSALRSLCNRGLVFHKGELAFDGSIDGAIEHYESLNSLKQ